MLVLHLSSFDIQHAVKSSIPSLFFFVWALSSVSCLNQPPVPLRTDTPQSPQFSHQSPSATDYSPTEVGPTDHARAAKACTPPPLYCISCVVSLQLYSPPPLMTRWSLTSFRWKAVLLFLDSCWHMLFRIYICCLLHPKYSVKYKCKSVFLQSLLDFQSHWFTFAGTLKGWCMKKNLP